MIKKTISKKSEFIIHLVRFLSGFSPETLKKPILVFDFLDSVEKYTLQLGVLSLHY